MISRYLGLASLLLCSTGCISTELQDLPVGAGLQTPTYPDRYTAAPTETQANASGSQGTPTGSWAATPSGQTPSAETASDTPSTPTELGKTPPLFTPTAILDQDKDGSQVPQDCDDSNSSVYPGATEVCDEVDQDCDGLVDETAGGVWYIDTDEDGYGDNNSGTTSCTAQGNWIQTSGDCNDLNSSINPAEDELCDDLDQDCDDAVDEGLIFSYYPDIDQDGYGNGDLGVDTCDPQQEWITTPGDCDDENPSAFPGAPFELQDATDHDCDGTVDESNVAAEAAYTFATGDGNSWTGSSIVGLGDFDGDGFDDFALGASLYDATRGAVTIYYGSAERWNEGSVPETSRLLGDGEAGLAGISLATGDFNGDGLPDLAVGQASYGGIGRVSIVLGSESRPANNVSLNDVALTVDSNSFAAGFGNSLTLTDFNQDGKDDLIVGAPVYERVYFIMGREGIDASDSILAEDDENATFVSSVLDGTFEGYGIASLGDVNNDDFPDVGASTYLGDNGGKKDSGAMQIFYGSNFGTIGTNGHMGTLYGQGDGDQMGWGMGSAGDLNGDSFDDFFVGAPFRDEGSANTGAIYAVLGGTTKYTGSETISNVPHLKVSCSEPQCFLGHIYTIQQVSDINKDGLDDFFLGGVETGAGPGMGGLFFGRPGGFQEDFDVYSADALFKGDNIDDNFGSVGNVGDIDGDGHADLVVGAYRATVSGEQVGRAYLFYGY